MRVANDYLFGSVSGPTTTPSQIVAATNSVAVDVSQMVIGDATALITDGTPAFTTFPSTAVDTTADTITLALVNYPTGLKVRFTTAGSLPSPLLIATDYFVIAKSTTLYQIASSLANALAGTAIDLTTQGTGTDTITPQALATGTVKLQKSNDLFINNVNGATITWFDIPSSSQTFSAAATLNWAFNDLSTNFGQIGFNQLRAVASVASGLADVTLKLVTKGGG